MLIIIELIRVEVDYMIISIFMYVYIYFTPNNGMEKIIQLSPAWTGISHLLGIHQKSVQR